MHAAILFPLAGVEGSKVELKPFREADITDNYLAWLNDADVVRYSNQRFRVHDRSSSLRYLHSFAGTDNLFLSVIRRAEGQVIGTMTAYIAKPHRTADVGVMIGEKSVWGRGYGQDAWNTLLEWLLHGVQLRKITAGTLACNFSMIKLMERSGMQCEAVRKQQEIIEGHAEDVLYFARFSELT